MQEFKIKLRTRYCTYPCSDSFIKNMIKFLPRIAFRRLFKSPFDAVAVGNPCFLKPQTSLHRKKQVEFSHNTFTSNISSCHEYDVLPSNRNLQAADIRMCNYLCSHRTNSYRNGNGFFFSVDIAAFFKVCTHNALPTFYIMTSEKRKRWVFVHPKLVARRNADVARNKLLIYVSV